MDVQPDEVVERPLDLKTIVELARAAMRRCDWAEAARGFAEARAQSPSQPTFYTGGVNALRAAGRIDEAVELAALAAERFPDDEHVALALAWMANAQQRWEDAAGLWAAALRRFPDNLEGYVGALAAARQTGNGQAPALAAAAEAALARAGGGNGDPVRTTQLQLAIAKARSDWPAVRRDAEALTRLDVAAPERAFLDLAQACWQLGEVEDAAAAARRALQLNPDLADAAILIALAATQLGDAEAALDAYGRLCAMQPLGVRWAIRRIDLLNWIGRVDEAVGEFEALVERAGDNPIVATFRANFGPGLAADDGAPAASETIERVLQAAPDEAARKRPPLTVAPRQEVQIARAVSEAAILVFTGAHDGLGMPDSVFDRFLAPLDLTAIYLKDMQRLAYLNGISQLSGDYEGTVSALKTLLDGLGARRLFTIGNCDGGLAAIRYGVELGAERIIAFGPPTHFPEGAASRLEEPRNIKRRRLEAVVPVERTDLRTFLERREHRSRIEVFFEAEKERESGHASRLEGLPGVSLHPLAGEPRHPAVHRLLLGSPGFGRTPGVWLGLEACEAGS